MYIPKKTKIENERERERERGQNSSITIYIYIYSQNKRKSKIFFLRIKKIQLDSNCCLILHHVSYLFFFNIFFYSR